MDLKKYRHTDSIDIAASPETVYALVADVTRMGDFSPVCKSAQWLDDDHTTFTGDNVLPDMQWSTTCRVDVTFTPAGDGTSVSEHWEVLPGYADFWASVAPDSSVEDYLDSVVDRTHSGMAETLANIKQAAEE
jgi:hypothetical protein